MPLLIKRTLLLLILTIILLVSQSPRSQAITPNSQEKALSLPFLSDVIQVDMTKYTATLTENHQFTTGEEHLSYSLYASIESHASAIFHFYNGTLGYCNLYPSWGRLRYSLPDSDPFNSTLGIMQRYQKWTNDSDVQEMLNLLGNVGSLRNATEASGNITLRILVLDRYTNYEFSYTFNGVDYSGITLFFGQADFFFTDYRSFEKIGDTSINVSKEQAITIAGNYVRNYSYTTTLGNGTNITVSGLTVTGVDNIQLGSMIRENSTLFPYWNVQVNVNNTYSTYLQGIGVQVWADDGTVSWSYRIANPIDIGGFTSSMFFSLFTAFISIVIVGIAVIIVLLLLIRKSNQGSKKPDV